MAQEYYKVSAPGSIMLMGEHAVLHGHAAIVCAVNKRLSVILTPRNDKKITIHSQQLGEYHTTLTTLQVEKPFQFILEAMQQFHAKLNTGCDIIIESHFSDKVGLGSSAAVTAATLAALARYTQTSLTKLALFKLAKQVVTTIQGQASGADIAASIFGGTLYYRPPASIETYYQHIPLTLVYSGHKVPTPEVIQKIEQFRLRQPALFTQLYQTMNHCTQTAWHAIQQNDWSTLGEICNIAQGLMSAIGASNEKLEQLCYQLRNQSDIYGAKISGAGLGDCVVAIGETHFSNQQQIAIQVNKQGLKNEMY